MIRRVQFQQFWSTSTSILPLWQSQLASHLSSSDLAMTRRDGKTSTNRGRQLTVVSKEKTDETSCTAESVADLRRRSPALWCWSSPWSCAVVAVLRATNEANSEPRLNEKWPVSSSREKLQNWLRNSRPAANDSKSVRAFSASDFDSKAWKE